MPVLTVFSNPRDPLAHLPRWAALLGHLYLFAAFAVACAASLVAGAAVLFALDEAPHVGAGANLAWCAAAVLGAGVVLALGAPRMRSVIRAGRTQEAAAV